MAQEKPKYYKSCFVPDCSNTSITAPEKEFISVPRTENKRKAWYESVGCAEKKIKLSSYCCEDHFDLKEDLENYMEYKMMGCKKLLKDNVVPHFFPNRMTSMSNSLTVEEDIQQKSLSSIVYQSEASALSDNSSLHSTKALGISRCSFHFQENVCTQTEPEVNHQYVQAKPSTLTKKIQTDILPATNSIGVICNIIVPTIINQLKNLKLNSANFNETVESISSSILDSSISYIPSNSIPSSTSEEKKLKLQILQDSVYEKYTKPIIEDNPLLFIGICKESMSIIDLLNNVSGLSVKDIYLVLKKIRTNLSYSALSYEFGLSESNVSRVIKKNIYVIAKYLKQLIVWSSEKTIALNLPLQFRYRYHDVQSIIDCFEIEIEKPSNAVHQALTWSEYKKCNTAKYLISVTPDGLINYISDGVCGRSSDLAIVENCGYLDKLPPNATVLADRGFKQVDALLHKKQCKLVRPPSVQQNVKLSKKDVRLTKQVASIRIHVERVINRIRSFRLLDIHTRVDNKLLDYLDPAVVIAAALVNLQSEIIKQD